MIESQDWKGRNWATSKRISELVFMPAVLGHLWALGVEVVDAKNIV